MAFFYGLLEVDNFIIKSSKKLIFKKINNFIVSQKMSGFLLLHYLLKAFFDMMIGVQLVGLGQS